MMKVIIDDQSYSYEIKFTLQFNLINLAMVVTNQSDKGIIMYVQHSILKADVISHAELHTCVYVYICIYI